jgi:glycosyltransferase involved in cell wall biosynthesis
MLAERDAKLKTTLLPFSVVITVRNECNSIGPLIEGLKAQSHQPEEIVIVDGASTDGTLQVLADYAQAGVITLISRPCNIAQGRNLGIAQARNGWIAVADAGCTIDRDWLAELAGCAGAHPTADVIAGNYAFEVRNAFEEAAVLATDTPNRQTTDHAKYYPSSRSVAFRKSAWEGVKGYPEWLYAAEDTLFNIRLRQLGFKFIFCREATVRWKPRPSLRAFAKQHFLYARGNGRVGIGTSGYIVNLQFHGAALAGFLAMFVWAPLGLVGAAILAHHVRRHLWRQATDAAVRSSRPGIRWRVLALMEVMRLAGMAGFLAGRFDRHRDPSFILNQKAWMGVSSLEDVPPFPD